MFFYFQLLFLYAFGLHMRYKHETGSFAEGRWTILNNTKLLRSGRCDYGKNSP